MNNSKVLHRKWLNIFLFSYLKCTCICIITGRDDLVRCYYCGMGLKDWSESDDPMSEHIRHSPDCNHLRRLIGESLFNTYRVRYCRSKTNISLKNNLKNEI